jgi:hypothetical protein
LYPATLEKLFMLEYNDRYWDVYTVAEGLRKASIARKENSKKKQRALKSNVNTAALVLLIDIDIAGIIDWLG